MSASKVDTKELDAMYQKLQDPKVNSLLKKHLTKDAFEKMKTRTTPMGGTLKECIEPGVINLDSMSGVWACDPKAYDTFHELFEPVIKDYHKVTGECKQPKSDYGDLAKLPFGDLDPKGEYIVSTRVRVGRSHDVHSFPPRLSEAEKLEMETKMKKVFASFDGVHQGTYYQLEGMDKKTEKQLVEDHFLFRDDDRYLRAAGAYNHWAKGRGIFHNKDKTFLVWVNEEDHLRIISMQMGGNVAEVYKRLIEGIQKMEKAGCSFAHHPKYGYLTFCPTNLGTSMRASVHVKIPWISSQPQFKEVCEAYKLQARGIHGEVSESGEGGVYDISNKRRLGLTEIQAATEMCKGVESLIKMEKEKKIIMP